MSTAPIRPITAPAPTESIEERFVKLADTWRREVAHHSSSTIRNNHPAYREIVALGRDVVPLLLRDLEAHHTHWFAALREITGANPVSATDAGNITRMSESWLHWARENGWRW